ncbi:hypothetical protein Tco_0450318 [Tanacetum coccineum]
MQNKLIVKDDTDDESDERIEAHYMYNAQLQSSEVQAELDKYNDVNMRQGGDMIVQKLKGNLMSIQNRIFEKASNAYTQKINDLNQTYSDMKKSFCAHQETIAIMSQANEAQTKALLFLVYKLVKTKNLDKFISLENKVQGI